MCEGGTGVLQCQERYETFLSAVLTDGRQAYDIVCGYVDISLLQAFGSALIDCTMKWCVLLHSTVALENLFDGVK